METSTQVPTRRPIVTKSPVDAARAYAARVTRNLFIGGAWVSPHGEAFIDVINPDTEERLATVSAADAEDVDRAVRAARAAFEHPSWSSITPHQRTNYLLKIADLIATHADELAAISSLEMGMPFLMSRFTTNSMVDVFRYYAGWPTKMFGKTNPTDTGSFSYTVREPLGVVGAIIPWNGPILYACWKIATALATGNTVVLKPAEQAPLTCLRFAEILQEAGLPDGVVNVVTGVGEVAGAALVEHPAVAKITFTGSTAVGRQIMAAASRTLKKVSLELGGKSPVVVFPDADLDRAVATLLLGFTGNSGQACTAPTRVLVHESIYDEVAERLVKGASELKLGSPFEETTQLGPLVSRERFERVTGYISRGRTEGARVLSGGDRAGSRGYFVQPTVFGGVKDDMTIAREEIFGPVGALMRFSDESDAVLRGNDTEYGLAASIWTKDTGRAHRVARQLRAGIVWLNTVFEIDPVAPFGGYKQSGLGRELGPESIDDFTQIKTVVLRY